MTTTENDIKQEETAVQAESGSVLNLAYKTALKTLLFFLTFVILLTSVLSFGVSGSEKVYFSLGLYEKAVSQSERDLKRKEKRLENFYPGSVEYQSYALNDYLPALSRTTDYAISYSVQKPNKKTAANAIKYIMLYLSRQGYSGNGSYSEIVSQKQMNSVKDSLKVYFFDYNSYLHYNLIRCSLIADKDDLFKYTSSTSIDLVTFRVSAQLGILSGENYINTFSNNKPDNNAITPYFDHILKSIDYTNPANLLLYNQGVNIELIKKTFNFSKYNDDLFSDIITYENNVAELTALYKDIKTVYGKQKEIINAQIYSPSLVFSPDATIEHKVRFLWYERVRLNISYSIASVLAVIRAYNTNTINSSGARSEIFSLVQGECTYWIEEYVEASDNFQNHCKLI